MWILPPDCGLYPSAPAEVGLTSACRWRLARLSRFVSLNGKASPSSSWFRAWQKGGWVRRLFGRICSPSTADLFMGWWIACLRDTPANRSASPVNVVDRVMLDTFGPTSIALLVKLNPASYFSKTCRAMSVWGSGRSVADLKEWAIRLRRDCSRRLKLVRLKAGNAFSLSLWPTPAARDHRGRNGDNHLQNGTGRKHLDQLPNYIEFVFLPHLTKSEIGCECSAMIGGRSRLNPTFVGWLMGWPISNGPNDFVCSAMEFARYRRLMHSSLCGLVSDLRVRGKGAAWRP